MSRWHFTDPGSGATYTMEIGPSGVNLPRKRRVTYAAAAAPDRTPVILTGANERPVLSLTGTLLSQAQLDAFNLWYAKGQVVYITDFLGQQYTALISKLTPKRERAASAPWKHTWTVEAYIFASHLIPSDVLIPADDLIPF